MATPTAVVQVKRATEVEPDGRGFAGSVRCASLADLVQLQCLSRACAAVAVKSSGREGELYFNEGEVIHARTRDLTGEAAAFEILMWEGGSFGTVELDRVPTRSMSVPWQHLLLLAAQHQDEGRRATTEERATRSEPDKSALHPVGTARQRIPPLPPLPARPPRANSSKVGAAPEISTPSSLAPAPAERVAPASVGKTAGGAERVTTLLVGSSKALLSGGASDAARSVRAPSEVRLDGGASTAKTAMFARPEESVVSAESGVVSEPSHCGDLLRELDEELKASVVCAVRLSREGRPLATRGEASALATLGSYARGIIDLIGEDLGLSGFRAFEGRSTSRQLLVYADRTGTLVALEAQPGADLTRLRSILGC